MGRQMISLDAWRSAMRDRAVRSGTLRSMSRHLWISGLLPQHHAEVHDLAVRLHNLGYEVHVQHVTDPDDPDQPTADDPMVPATGPTGHAPGDG